MRPNDRNLKRFIKNPNSEIDFILSQAPKDLSKIEN